MAETYRCLYCHGPCTIEEKDKKVYLNCPNCGKKEGTPMLKKRLEAKRELER